ncbi:Dfp1/Him1, central region-domain-containing protein [Crepidotus variabilis]|uniref:Dfp1/Him1, central region-domain-containing protein n=1 Tax=Crepidotus variabilis TaxID=179855 RepID=A0A9P6JQ73_9AGAR|nr:Dfp1/Him1, central region-domain-containing protein [Crepidotus variabilis]
MASVCIPHRRPLSNRTLHQSPSKVGRVVSGSKRARSPDHGVSHTLHAQKRARPTNSIPAVSASTSMVGPSKSGTSTKDKDTLRQEQAKEFRDKYRKAFPAWKFYFDTAHSLSEDLSDLKADVSSMKGHIVQFFDGSVTHVISDRPLPLKANSDKENEQTIESQKHSLKSPVKLLKSNNDCLQQAVDRGMKIWKASKLRSVLDRCISLPSAKASTSARPSQRKIIATQKAALSKLLAAEKIHGTTERDPSERRNNYQYFAPDSHFVLIEDIHQQLATLSAHEYPAIKDSDAKKPWPVLYCHPQARNPFLPFDEREKRRWDKVQKAEKDEEEQRAQRKKQREIAALKRKAESKKVGDLRRSVSLSNLQRQLTNPVDDYVDLDADGDELYESAKASGYLASGNGAYVAASGNSVGITSTTGTTSTSGRTFRSFSLKLPGNIAQRMKDQIVTSRRVGLKDKAGPMGPPALPERHTLKKSKSMNIVKSTKREEGTKPGYCESCRSKFKDFDDHLISNKHIAFSRNPANFEALDFVIGQLKRQTCDEVEQEERERLSRFRSRCRATLRTTSMQTTPT